MRDDSLSSVWTGDPPMEKNAVLAAVTAVLHEDRASRERERAIRIPSLLALAVLCPVLLWCAAYGISPIIRGAYALMAAGSAVLVATEWMFFEWDRHALPGPMDARSQLQKTAFMLARQATLMKTALLWSAPVFIGTALIGLWLYQERSHGAGYLLWAFVGPAWCVASIGGGAMGVKLDQRRLRIERLLTDLA